MKEFEITKSVRYSDITVLYDLFKQYGLIELLNGLIPRRGLPVDEVFASLAINLIIGRETLNKFSKWYLDTALEELTGITPEKLNSSNLGEIFTSREHIVAYGMKVWNLLRDLGMLILGNSKQKGYDLDDLIQLVETSNRQKRVVRIVERGVARVSESNVSSAKHFDQTFLKFELKSAELILLMSATEHTK